MKGTKLKIYLDNSAFNRPFDRQDQVKICLETFAKLHIQTGIKNKIYDLVWSFMNDIENRDNPYYEKRKSIGKWKDIASGKCKSSIDVLNKGKEIAKLNVAPKDALHIACAIESNCDYFITTDEKLIKKLNGKETDGLKIINPLDFVRENRGKYEN
jgi:predicted nucleic acid-binding protein